MYFFFTSQDFDMFLRSFCCTDSSSANLRILHGQIKVLAKLPQTMRRPRSKSWLAKFPNEN